MKHYLYLLSAFSAIFIFSCGEVGDGGYSVSNGGSFGASCNGISYDASKSFCFEDKIYPLCDKNAYDPGVEGCLEGVVYPKCGEIPYDVAKSFCFGDSIYSKCGGEAYFPNLEFCFNKEVFSKCEDKPFNPSKEFCFENKAYLLCNGSSYNVTTHLCFNKIKERCPNSSYDDEFCEDGISYRICGDKEYKTDSTFCFKDEIYQKCGGKGGKDYDPSTEFCYDNKDYYPRCGGNMYSPINDFCFGDKVYSKCGGKTYNPKESFCSKEVILPLCNGAEVPEGHFCSDDFKVLPKCKGNIYDTKKAICYKNDIYAVCPDGEFAKTISECTSGPKYSLCGGEKYETAKEFCYGDMPFPKCGINMDIEYDPSNEFCGEDKEKHNLCRVQIGVNDLGAPIYNYQRYNTNSQVCGADKIEDKYLPQQCERDYDKKTEFCCFGKIYPLDGLYFCYPEEQTKDKPQQLYPKCGDPSKKYNPLDSGCFEGKIYAKCLPENGDTRGVCVDSDDKGPFKRCKQLGNGKNYVIDPLPEMTCQSNGAITGTTSKDNYKIAQIGNQVWLAANLIDKRNPRPPGSTCYGGIASTNCEEEKYGSLYDWKTAMRLENEEVDYNIEFYNPAANLLIRGPCPDGFYLPRDEDWQKLIDYAGGPSIAGGRLKSTSDWNNNGNGVDAYGFNALPGGYYSELAYSESTAAGYSGKGSRVMWWSMTEHPNSDAYYWTIISSDSEARKFYQSKRLHKAYVRCLLYYKE